MSKGKILIVDDEAQVVARLKTRLGAILLDVLMPKLSGYEVVEKKLSVSIKELGSILYKFGF